MRNRRISYYVIGVLLLLIIWQTSLVQYFIFKYVNNSEAAINNYSVSVDSNWYVVLNSETDFISNIVSLVLGKKTKYPTIGFDNINCKNNMVCTIDIDFIKDSFGYRYAEGEILSLPWGLVEYIGDWKADNGVTYHTYYLRADNIRITVSDNSFISDILKINKVE